MKKSFVNVCTAIIIVLTVILIRIAGTSQCELYTGNDSVGDYVPSRYPAIYQSEEYGNTEYTPCEYAAVFQQE